MVQANGTVSFIESFHGRLDFRGRAFVNSLSGKGCLLGRGRASQWASPLPRVNTVRRQRSFLCRSHVELQATHIANKHRGTHRGLRPKLNWAACPRQSANRSGNSTTHTPSPCLAVRLTRPAHQLLPGTLMLGYTGLNCQQPIMQTEVQVMQSICICAGYQAKAAHTTLPACTGLTGRSTRTSMLRIAAG
jgi:hypothetical protein